MTYNPPNIVFTIDAHLDLSMNALEWNRDLRKSAFKIREEERGWSDLNGRGNGTVAFPEMRKGKVGLCVATLIARFAEFGSRLPGWRSPEQAWAQTQGQLAWYQAMVDNGEMSQIFDLNDLNGHVDLWASSTIDQNLPIGFILSLEGADSIVDLGYLEKAYGQGLRAVGPAHYGPGVYAFGTDSDGPLGAKGRALLREMDNLNLILDVTHLSDTCFWEAMDIYKGRVWASHSNCRALVNHNRQFDDEQIKVLIDRGAVIGGAFDAWMLAPDWKIGSSLPMEMGVTLNSVLDHMDHICQIAGNARHIGLGTDLDGGFGKEQSPSDLDSIADLQKIPSLLADRGYSDQDIEGIMHGNWIRFLREAWS